MPDKEPLTQEELCQLYTEFINYYGLSNEFDRWVEERGFSLGGSSWGDIEIP